MSDLDYRAVEFVYKLRRMDAFAAHERLTSLLTQILQHPNAHFNVAACTPGEPTIEEMVRAAMENKETT